MRTERSLFPDEDSWEPLRPKKPRLGRYERIKRGLEENKLDIRKRLVMIADNDPIEHFDFVDLFCGAGGLTLGFQQSGFNPVASVEISPIASETHRRNFPDCKHYCGDISEFEPTEWLSECRPVHLVVGGPPCQGFSVAGRRDPNDPRNRLFYEFIRVVKQIRPWYVVMENVPGILTMQGGAVKDAILDSFAEAGYPEMSVSVLESADYGVAQIRPRAIFIANRLGLDNPYPAPQFTSDNYRPIESAIMDLPAYEPLPGLNHEWTRHSPSYMERLAQVPPGGSLYATYADAFKRQYPGLPSMTIKENHGGTHIHPHLNRVISAREMARLQSFPDSFLFEGPMKKAMWQIGNAVPPRLGECIGRALRIPLSAYASGATHEWEARRTSSDAPLSESLLGL